MVLKNKIWAVVPAAGVGARMEADKPKQYLPLADKLVIEWSLENLLRSKHIQGVELCVAPSDPYIKDVLSANDFLSEQITNTRLILCDGGATRAHSVLNGLRNLAVHAHSEDWVLVHDAARPLLHSNDLERLINTVVMGGHGGILAAPSADTLKRESTDQFIEQTVSRVGIWAAQTPQMFKLNELHVALSHALENNLGTTDEASAMELSGAKVVMIESHHPNFKLTTRADFELAEAWILASQQHKA